MAVVKLIRCPYVRDRNTITNPFRVRPFRARLEYLIEHPQTWRKNLVCSVWRKKGKQNETKTTKSSPASRARRGTGRAKKQKECSPAGN